MVLEINCGGGFTYYVAFLDGEHFTTLLGVLVEARHAVPLRRWDVSDVPGPGTPARWSQPPPAGIQGG